MDDLVAALANLPGQPGGRVLVEVPAGAPARQRRQLGFHPDRDARLLVVAAQRALAGAEDFRTDRPRGVQPRHQLELDPRRTFPVQVVGHRQQRDRPGIRADRDDGRLRPVRLVVGVVMRAEVWVDAIAVQLAERGELARIIALTPRQSLVMIQLGLRAVDAPVAGVPQAIAVVGVVVGDGEPVLVEAAELGEQLARSEHAGRGDRQGIPRHIREIEWARIPPGKEPERVPGESLVERMRDARVLDAAVRVQEPRPTAPTPSSRNQPTIWLSQRGLITSVSSLRNSSNSSSTIAAAALLMAAKLNRPSGLAMRSTRWGRAAR